MLRRTQLVIVVAMVATAWLVMPASADDRPGGQPHTHGDEAHVHASVPSAYRSVTSFAAIWTDAGTLARGQAIYVAKCAVCHGEHGGGDGPAATGLPLKPPSLKDTRMVAEMTPAYWF